MTLDNKYINRLNEAVPHPKTFTKKLRYLLRKKTLDYLSLRNKNDEKLFMRCLYCHYVFDDQIEDFEKLITQLKNIGDFVDTDTCIDILKNNKIIDGKYFHLSFDDGFKNNITNAIPVLDKYSVPAIFFIPTSLIGSSWEESRIFCKERTNYGDVIEFLDWPDILNMISLGFEIGSHTSSHFRLSDISSNKDKLLFEIKGSKDLIEKKLKVPCKYISWPFGLRSDVNKTSIKVIENANYKACFGAFRGSIIPNKTNKFMIPRHHFEVEWPIAHTKYFLRGNMEKIQ